MPTPIANRATNFRHPTPSSKVVGAPRYVLQSCPPKAQGLANLVPLPPPVANNSDRVEEEYERLVRFQQRAEVEARSKIDQAMRDASTGLLIRLTNMATERGLSPLLSNMSHKRFLLRLQAEDNLWVQVSHWAGLVGSTRSDVEACYDFISAQTPNPYYEGPAADLRRLKQAVGDQAPEIFATLATHDQTYS